MPTLEQQLTQTLETLQSGIDLLSLQENLIAATTGKSAAVFKSHMDAIIWSKKTLNTMSSKIKLCETLLKGSTDERDLARIEMVGILESGLPRLIKKADGLVPKVKNSLKDVISQLQEQFDTLCHDASKSFKPNSGL